VSTFGDLREYRRQRLAATRWRDRPRVWLVLVMPWRLRFLLGRWAHARKW
jgi:hypothetical protein